MRHLIIFVAFSFFFFACSTQDQPKPKNSTKTENQEAQLALSTSEQSFKNSLTSSVDSVINNGVTQNSPSTGINPFNSFGKNYAEALDFAYEANTILTDPEKKGQVAYNEYGVTTYDVHEKLAYRFHYYYTKENIENQVGNIGGIISTINYCADNNVSNYRKFGGGIINTSKYSNLEKEIWKSFHHFASEMTNKEKTYAMIYQYEKHINNTSLLSNSQKDRFFKALAAAKHIVEMEDDIGKHILEDPCVQFAIATAATFTAGGPVGAVLGLAAMAGTAGPCENSMGMAYQDPNPHDYDNYSDFVNSDFSIDWSQGWPSF